MWAAKAATVLAAEVSEQLVEVPGIIFSTLQAARVLQLSPAGQKKHRLNLQFRCCARFSFDLLFTGFSRICASGFHNIYLLFGCCHYFQASKLKGRVEFVTDLLGLSILQYGSHATIISPYINFIKTVWLWLKPFNGFDSVVLWTDLHFFLEPSSGPKVIALHNEWIKLKLWIAIIHLIIFCGRFLMTWDKMSLPEACFKLILLWSKAWLLQHAKKYQGLWLKYLYGLSENCCMVIWWGLHHNKRVFYNLQYFFWQFLAKIMLKIAPLKVTFHWK